MSLTAPQPLTEALTLAVQWHTTGYPNTYRVSEDVRDATRDAFATFIGTSEVSLSALQLAVAWHTSNNPNSIAVDLDTVLATASDFETYIND